MNGTESVLSFMAILPPPPIPGGGAASDIWWRIVGILLVSLIAITLFMYLFRPLTPAPAEGAEEQREEEELARLAAQIAARMDESPPAPVTSVIPFRGRANGARGVDAGEVSNASARLRRILGQPAPGGYAADADRRRLGHRRQTPQPPDAPAPVPAGAATQPHPPDAATSAQPGAEVDPDLLGDLVNRLPSEADQPDTASGSVSEPSEPAADVPTEHDLTRLAVDPRAPGRIVPFKPRTTVPSAVQETELSAKPAKVRTMPVNPATRKAVEEVVRQLLFFANVGEVLQGFGLYTDEHLRRFMADSGMPEREFQALFAAVPPKEAEDWTRIEFISRIVRLEDGRISADVQYVDGHRPNGTERIFFLRDPETKRWLIDDIQAT